MGILEEVDVEAVVVEGVAEEEEEEEEEDEEDVDVVVVVNDVAVCVVVDGVENDDEEGVEMIAMSELPCLTRSLGGSVVVTP